MKSYLIDTNICIYYIKGKFNLKEKFNSIPKSNRFISEITLAELKYGVKNSQNPDKNQIALEDFLSGVQILPIFNSLDLYATEKARLRKSGQIIDDFDLLIGVSAISNDLILVTNNESHFGRINEIKIENWTKTL
ncbi:tRNA(fMet)-specific endonuclease VapC [Breznakibacter xylanolyticus]|uniref:Ribonuclease VapC n=1 Tax=Breznakibacter xylanolyticus TaxID=990 RepID=A0A2W7NHG2_9BACT|nr:type II toxin-antitoxin system VapC family toxin [Breznakibacter xylanolyticus]PZX19290.1 tRNA(fMet)-specific endonuclease VapC [Breznakibacter xylanolyticus]